MSKVNTSARNKVVSNNIKRARYGWSGAVAFGGQAIRGRASLKAPRWTPWEIALERQDATRAAHEPWAFADRIWWRKVVRR